jgi:5-(carboxyamino)imidazole ribonucleotide mutase
MGSSFNSRHISSTRLSTAKAAIGEPGAKNAGILAAQILALSDPILAGRLTAFREAQTEAVHETVED